MNKHFGATRHRWLLVAAGTLIYTGSAWATTNSCPNATSSSSVNNGTTANTVTIPGVSGGSPANDLASLASGGCTAVDLNFTNFNNSTFNGTGVNGIETAAGTYLAETPSGTANNPLTNPDTLLFATVNAAASGTGTAADGTPNDGNNNWVSTKNAPITDDITFNVSNSGNNAGEVINSILLTVYQPAVSPSGTASITIDICEGTAPNTQITTAGACTTAGGTAFVTSTLTLSTAPTLTLDVPLTALTSAFDITTIVNLSDSGTNKIDGFDAFSETFEEGPEPSTFVLFGAALAALGLLRFRAHRKAAVRSVE